MDFDKADIDLRALVNKAGMGIVIINQDHKVIEANQRFCEMLGYTPQEVLDLHTWDWEADQSEADIRKSFAQLDRVQSFFETRHRRKETCRKRAEISQLRRECRRHAFYCKSQGIHRICFA